MFRVEVKKLVGAGRITTGLWPGFPSDLVSLVTVLATQAEGATLVHDWMYELRLFALEQMSGMGADLFLCDPHRIIVTGPRRLRGKSLDSRDIRSGMALIAAALIADGQSRVEPLETVERGYSRLVERLQKLGASVVEDLGGLRPQLLRRLDRRLHAASPAPAPASETPAPGQERRRVLDRRLAASAAAAESAAAARMSVSGAPPSRRHAERLQIFGGQVQHPHNPRRQRQDDVGFRASPCGCSRTDARSPGCRRGRESSRTTCALRRESSPASMLVSPSFSRITVLIERLPNVGRPPKPVPEMLLNSIFSASDTASS